MANRKPDEDRASGACAATKVDIDPPTNFEIG
jgi:hypothetical protein